MRITAWSRERDTNSRCAAVRTASGPSYERLNGDCPLYLRLLSRGVRCKWCLTGTVCSAPLGGQVVPLARGQGPEAADPSVLSEVRTDSRVRVRLQRHAVGEVAAAELVRAARRSSPARPSCARAGGCRGGPRRARRAGPRARRATASPVTPAYLKPTVWSRSAWTATWIVDAARRGRSPRGGRARRPRARPATWPSPPSRKRRPPMETAPLAIHGLSAPPTRTRAMASSSHASGSSSKPAACSQTQRSACSRAPVVADGRAPADDVDAARRRAPPGRSRCRPGTGASSLVRGTGSR